MCEENNELELELEEKKRNLDEVFCGERTEFERLQKNSDTTDWSDFDYKDSLQHKGNAKQKHLRCKKGEANQKQQLSDYKSIHSYTCD